MRTPGSYIWLRLNEVEKCCGVHLESFQVNLGDGELTRWRMTITHRDSGKSAPVIAEAASAVVAAQDALAKMEAMGWI